MPDYSSVKISTSPSFTFLLLASIFFASVKLYFDYNFTYLQGKVWKMGDVVCMGVEFHFCRECEKCARRQSTAHRASPPSPSRAPPPKFFSGGGPRSPHIVTYSTHTRMWNFAKAMLGNKTSGNNQRQCSASAQPAQPSRFGNRFAMPKEKRVCLVFAIQCPAESNHIFFSIFFFNPSRQSSANKLFFFSSITDWWKSIQRK